MRNSLAVKLILAFLAVAVMAAVLVAVFVRRSTADELYRVILDQQTERLRNELIRYYRDTKTWDGVALFISRNDPVPLPDPQQPTPPKRLRFGLTDTSGRVFLPWADRRIGDVIPAEQLREGTPLVVDGATAGYFFVVNINMFASPEAAAYLEPKR
jgi:hypothetical protein